MPVESLIGIENQRVDSKIIPLQDMADFVDKFCQVSQALARKGNPRFLGLPLNTKTMIDHTNLCHFRSFLSLPSKSTDSFIFCTFSIVQAYLISIPQYKICFRCEPFDQLRLFATEPLLEYVHFNYPAI